MIYQSNTFKKKNRKVILQQLYKQLF